MRVPFRKAEKSVKSTFDPFITKAKFDELKIKLEKLKKAQPAAIEEVQRLAQMGDFSENAAYQMAKGRLRNINQQILELENQLAHSELITPDSDTSCVRVGHKVTVESNAQQRTYQILGSAESNPTLNIISQNSPLGKALLGKKIGDVIIVQLANKSVEYKIIKIE
ncbi:GreA/GreB family elongation factor [Candidatus Falkowbacteria bacterium]|nr:GreA/GreB family elongation factor [Candidatus Falkowbacteria bacterium]